MTQSMSAEERREATRRWQASRVTRREPLAKCPDAHCARQARCLKLSYGEECLKTHHISVDDWRGFMTAYIYKFLAESGAQPDGEENLNLSEADALAIVNKEIRKRSAEGG